MIMRKNLIQLTTVIAILALTILLLARATTKTPAKEELEDIGLAKMMHSADKSKKASRSEILKKLNS